MLASFRQVIHSANVRAPVQAWALGANPVDRKHADCHPDDAPVPSGGVNPTPPDRALARSSRRRHLPRAPTLNFDVAARLERAAKPALVTLGGSC